MEAVLSRLEAAADALDCARDATLHAPMRLDLADGGRYGELLREYARTLAALKGEVAAVMQYEAVPVRKRRLIEDVLAPLEQRALAALAAEGAPALIALQAVLLPDGWRIGEASEVRCLIAKLKEEASSPDSVHSSLVSSVRAL